MVPSKEQIKSTTSRVLFPNFTYNTKLKRYVAEACFNDKLKAKEGGFVLRSSSAQVTYT